MANRIAQLRNGALFQHRLGGDAAAAGGAVDQQFGDQPVAGLSTGLALCFVILDQALQLGARTLQQQGQAFVQASFTIFRWRHAVERHQGVQAEASQGFAPFTFAVAGAGDKVEHRQQRAATHGQHRQFVAVLGQHRLTHVDHIQAGVGGQQLTQYLGLLFVALARLAAFEKTRQARRAVQAFTGAVEALQVVEQGNGVFQAGGVVQLQQRLAVYRQARTFDMARGACARRDFAELHVAGQGAQQRGLADVGVADQGQFQWWAHGVVSAG